MLYHLRIEMRFRRRARLPPRVGAIDLRRGRFKTDAADIGEHFAGGIVEHDARAVANAVRAQPRKLAAQDHDRGGLDAAAGRSEEHTSELQSLMRISYVVFCLKKKTILCIII